MKFTSKILATQHTLHKAYHYDVLLPALTFVVSHIHVIMMAQTLVSLIIIIDIGGTLDLSFNIAMGWAAICVIGSDNVEQYV